MIKTIWKILLFVIIFASGVYWFMQAWFWQVILTINNDFIAYVPLELRFMIYSIIVALLFGVVYMFIS